MKDSLKSTPELGRENEKPRSLAENTFHDIAKYLPADETYLTLNSREDGIEGFYMRYDKEEVISGVTKWMPAIHYRKAIRTAPEKVITARNAYHAQAVKNLAEAQISLERYEKRKAWDDVLAAARRRVAYAERDLVRNPQEFKTDLSMEYIEAVLHFDVKTKQFFYYSSRFSGSALGYEGEKWSLRVLDSFPGSFIESKVIPVKISSEKAFQILNQMRLELDASMKKQKIQSNTSLLLSELQERILDEEVEIFA